MAVSASAVQHPIGRNPDYGTGERNTFVVRGNGTNVIAALGGGFITSIISAVAGTLAIFYDTPSGGTADDTTQIAEVDLSTLTFGQVVDLNASFSRGLTVVITGTNAAFTVTGRWSRGSTRTILRTLPRQTL